MGIIRRPWLTRASGGNLARTPLLFTRSAMGFLMTTESQDLILTSHPKDRCEHPRCSETQEVQVSCRLGRKSHTFRSSVHCEPEFEAIWMPRLNLLQLILQQNVLLSLGDRRKVNRFVLYLPRSSICLNIIYLRLLANQKRDSTHTQICNNPFSNGTPTWLANSRLHVVESFGFLMMSRISCNNGVMPTKGGEQMIRLHYN